MEGKVEVEFEPKILGFLCNWCSYAGGDLAGVSRLQYPPNIRVVRVMCSGRIDPVFVLDALEKGIDGVLILGCHLGDCHYIDGNYQTKTKFEMLQQLLSIVHLQSRIDLDWVSAAEGTYFAKIVEDYTNKIKKLGPSPLSQRPPDPQLVFNLKALRRVITDSRVRKLVGREHELVTKGNVYEEPIPEQDFKALLKQSLLDEYHRQQIYLSLQQTPTSVKDLAPQLNLDSKVVFDHLVVLKQRGLVELSHINELSPLYKAMEKVSE
jgi:F420-non-reducing hydrogenase iron-sulfur subunit